MGSIDAIIQPKPLAAAVGGAASYRVEIPAGWGQGRGAFGGLAIGALAQAIIDTAAAGSNPGDAVQHPRSINASLPAPAMVGGARIDVAPVRLGSGTSTYNAVLIQEDAQVATATATLGRDRIADRNWTPEPPKPEVAWADAKTAPIEAPMGPEFTQHFMFRPLSPLPYAGVDTTRAHGWFMPREPIASLGAAAVVALADTWWPAALAMETRPRPVGTIASTTQLYPTDAPLSRAGPFYHLAFMPAARGGYLTEYRELWTESGELLATNQQTFVWIK